MEIKGIDVSAYQGNIDWKTVADYGMGFAILRITEKGNVIDSTFERNYEGCVNNNIPVGVYKYSYAMSVAEIQKEAQKVVDVLDGRKLDFPVWLDLEHPDQRNLSKSTFETMIKTFWSVVKAAGYKFGIYSNVDWYENIIPESTKPKYDFWIARYPANDDGWLQERLRPSYGVGWQYSSKATIPGIPTKVDRNVFYKDYKEESGIVSYTKSDAISRVIDIAKAEVGYLEKASNSQLDSKTANAGSGNYTKYWRDTYPSYQGQPWCADFISWVLMKAFDQVTAAALLKHWPYVYCPTLGNLFTRYANPEVGDIVIFYRSGTFTHTGIVTKVVGDRFETIEGNTSGASGVVANGGGVCAKSYLNSTLPGTKFCRVDWNIAIEWMNKNGNASQNTTPGRSGYMFSPEIIQKGSTGTSVLLLQEILRARGFKGKDGKELELDRSFGDNVQYALKAYQKSRKGVLEVDGICGTNTWKDLIAI
mgnify:FL=1